MRTLLSSLAIIGGVGMINLSCHSPKQPLRLPAAELEAQLGESLLQCVNKEANWHTTLVKSDKAGRYKLLMDNLQKILAHPKVEEYFHFYPLRIYEIKDNHNLGIYLLPGHIILFGRGLWNCFTIPQQADYLLYHCLAHLALRHPLQLLLRDYTLKQLEEMSQKKQHPLCSTIAQSMLLQSFPLDMEQAVDSLLAQWFKAMGIRPSPISFALLPCSDELADEEIFTPGMAHPALGEK
ncbi:MAG: hypothetical protein NZM65_05675 [Flavobacteriales bacterium]|nr:hypothetical protein [Flavobacteriales bacterium]MDW8410162.1 hypothetical protein [Flavobacteriales bacterium]